ncbi:Zinc finger protein 850 [Frankliniella fusca]|uniref:Zinc finger protein 850 n=1 Tax=Frankliniella fusca TaxID=407009 RepID=A0AAE1H605_9NEOP|nr:Zinc finger protein 850 [Frankliniella fusca]
MKRVQQAQSAVSANASNPDQIPTDWIEQSKSIQPNVSNSNSTLINTSLECRFCAKPFVYESTLLEHEELHAKGVVTNNDSLEEMEQITPKECVGNEQLVQSSTAEQTRETATPLPARSSDPVSVSSLCATSSISVAAPSPPLPSAVCAPASTAVPTSALASAPVVQPARPAQTPVAASTPTPTSTPTPALLPAPAPATAPAAVMPSSASPAPVSESAPTPSPAPAPVLSPMSSLSGSVLPVQSVPIPTPESASGEVIEATLATHDVYNAHTALNEKTSNTQDTVDTVSLTDVTALLLEGAFEGVKSINNPALSLCRYCKEHFNSTDLLRRHERLYCNRKPLIVKQKLPLPVQQQQQNTQHPPQSSVDTALPTEGHSHLVVHQQPLQGQSNTVHQPPIQHTDQQIIYKKKVFDESTLNEAPQFCKHCHKEFIHRGSLWRHQMFCDANPERDLNRIAAGSRKKPVATKGCNQRNNAQQHSNVSGVNILPNYNIISVSGPQQRSGNTQPNSSPLKCKFCEKRFLHRGSWWRHQKMFCAVNPDIPTVKVEARSRTIQGIANFACRYCERTFLHRGSCWHHEQTHTGIKEHACRYCSKTFSEKSRLARHERMHLGIKPFSCHQCGKAFCDASNLRNHEQIHGDRASFLCAWCGKSYTRRALLLKHERVHAGEAQIFQCSLCPRTFPDSNTLNEHALSHKQEKRRIYLCQTCGQTFRSQRLLSQHNEINHIPVLNSLQQTQPIQESSSVNQAHLAQEPSQLSCTVCNKSFPDLPAFQQHELHHRTESKPYNCSHNDCKAVFHEQSLLEAHMLNHDSEKAHLSSPSISLSEDSNFDQHRLQLQHSHSQQQPEAHQQHLISHEIQHQQPLQQHALMHQEGGYIMEGQEMQGQTIAVHHLVGQIPQ